MIINIIYATESGNAKKIAEETSNLLSNENEVTVYAVEDFSLANVVENTLSLMIFSTQGQGDFTDNAWDFYDEVGAYANQLNGVHYAILGLGDSSYSHFCNAGVLLQEAFEKTEAEAILPLCKADVDFSKTAKNWQEAIIRYLKEGKIEEIKEDNSQNGVQQSVVEGKIIENKRITAINSAKTTHEIIIEPNALINYQAGDCIGIYPENTIKDCQEILDFYESTDGSKLEVLLKRSIKGLTHAQCLALLNKGFKIYSFPIDLITILRENNKNLTIEELMTLLEPITARLYSIASSPKKNPKQIRLVIGLDQFEDKNKEETVGVASSFLINQGTKKTVKLYHYPVSHFKLPEGDKDIVMIATGTGIAPFIGFLEEREATQSKGKNELIFGEQHRATEFYFQQKLENWLDNGVLKDLQLAFSRDGAEKCYVQHILQQQKEKYYELLKKGTHFYICGNKNHLKNIVEEQLGIELKDFQNQIHYDIY